VRKCLAGIAALILLLTPLGCARSSRSAAKPAQSPAAGTAAASAPGLQSAARPAPAPAGRDTITLAQEQPAPAAIAPRQSTDVSSLLPLGRDGPTLPQDFKIGILGDARAGDADDRQALATATSFLARLVGGKVDAALLDPADQSRITDMLDFGIQRGDVPRSYRIGAPRKHEDGEVTASVRLFGSEGTSEGEIAVARTGGHWLVTDLQISLDDMQVKAEKPKERFFPSSYRWMLEQ
jgi:hypothetical protein